MAESTTITKPAPVIEGSLTAFLKSIDKLGAGAVPTGFAGIDPSKYAPKIAAESQLQQDARTAAGGLGSLTGPQAYQPFMSPYQQEIINTTLADFDRQAQIGQQTVSDAAYTAGAFGGGREGVARAEYQSNSDRNRAALLAGLYGQGYNQALTQQQQQLGNLQGMAGLVPGLQQQNIAAFDALGQQDQLLEQSKLNAIAQANQSAYQLPLDRITDVANIYGTVSGATNSVLNFAERNIPVLFSFK